MENSTDKLHDNICDKGVQKSEIFIDIIDGSLLRWEGKEGKWISIMTSIALFLRRTSHFNATTGCSPPLENG